MAREKFDYNSALNTATVRNENLEGFSLKFVPEKADNSLATLQALNKIKVKVMLVRNNQKIVLYSGDVQRYNAALYNGTPIYDLNIAVDPDNKTYVMNFRHGAINLSGNDYYYVECTVENTAFTSLVVANSTFEFETISTIKNEDFVYVVEDIPVGDAKEDFDQPLDSNIVQLIASNDYANDAYASAKSKVKDYVLTAVGVKISRSGTLARRMQRENAYSKTNAPFNTVLFQSQFGEMLTKAHLKLDYTEAVDSDARILITRKLYLQHVALDARY